MMKSKSKRQVCVLLPNKQHLECTVEVKARGQDVLDNVSKQLEISQQQIFGLAVLRGNEYIFLDLEQKLVKYFGKGWKRGSEMVPFILFLRVQYYVDSGLLIQSSRVLQLYYTELRQKVLRSQSCHQEALFFQLASSALQAEVGDLELGENGKHKHYFLPEDYFPSWLIKRRGRDYLLQHCPALHEELRGVSHREAVLEFVKLANTVEDAPLTLYRMRQGRKELKSSILFGVAPNGVCIYQDVEGKCCLWFELSWTEMERITFQGSRFEIRAIGSLCLPKLAFYSQSAFHSKHVLKHLRDSHHFNINVRDAVSYVRQLENLQASHLYKEAYICDTTLLRQRLQCLISSMTDCSTDLETSISEWNDEEEQGHNEDKGVGGGFC